MHTQPPQVVLAAHLMVGAVEGAKTEEAIGLPPMLVAAVRHVGMVDRKHELIIFNMEG